MIETESFLDIRLAGDERDIRGAQRLRYRVFVEELGGTGAPADHAARLERDRFDPHCEHLVLIDRRAEAADPGGIEHVVGAYRLMTEAGAGRAGQFYSEEEFDLTPLRASGRRLLELGRSCVDRRHRGGMALFLLWNGLAEYVRRHRIELLFGVASFHGTDPDALALPLSYLQHHHLAPAALRPRSRQGASGPPLLPAGRLDRLAAMRAMPSLIKSYLRLGGRVGEGVFVDRAFNTTDVCLLLDTARLSPRRRALYRGGAAR